VPPAEAGPRRGKPVIEVSELVKRYRGAPLDGAALDGVSFEVAEGALFCLLGPNGAGKTTTASILTTTLAPTSGRASIAGLDVVADQARVRREVGIVFQQPSLDANLTAEENIRLHAVLYGCYPWRPSWRLMPGAYRRQVTELTEILSLADWLHRPARTLSGGTKRKLEIVRALLPGPRVLFLDEPTAGLDPQTRRGLWTYLGQARAERDVTVFLTTHYLEEAEAADAVCVLAGGRVVEHGSPADIKARYLRPAPSGYAARPAASLEDAYLALLDRAGSSRPVVGPAADPAVGPAADLARPAAGPAAAPPAGPAQRP
jgi:ABC-2 type transport system ATP-binding protein